MGRAPATRRGHRQSAPLRNGARWVSATAGLSCKPRACQRTRWETRWCSAQGSGRENLAEQEGKGRAVSKHREKSAGAAGERADMWRRG